MELLALLLTEHTQLYNFKWKSFYLFFFPPPHTHLKHLQKVFTVKEKDKLHKVISSMVIPNILLVHFAFFCMYLQSCCISPSDENIKTSKYRKETLQSSIFTSGLV